MKHFYTKATLLLSSAVCALAVSAAPALSTGDFLPKSLNHNQQNRELRAKKGFSVDELEKRAAATSGKAYVKPSITFDNIPRYDYLEGPDGSIWYYTVEYKTEKIEHNPWWTEEVLKGYTFTIYNQYFETVGTVTDDIVLGENETRAREILMDGAVTRHFFNQDDNLEVIVRLVMNTEQYQNHNYNLVYSLGGEKDDNGNDISVARFEGLLADAVNAGTPDNENFYLTFVTDPDMTYEGDKATQAYIDFLNTLEFKLDTYSKATDDKGPQLYLTKGIGITRVPGDSTNGMYYISKVHDGKLYIVYSQYEKPYLIEPVLVNGNEGATPDNTLVIETYCMDGATPELKATTRIRVVEPDSSETLHLAQYSIGSIAWSDDIDMTVNGTPDAPAFVVAHDVEEAATEDLTSSYEIFNSKGELLHTVDSGSQNIATLALPGYQPQILSLHYDPEIETYSFKFNNLYDGKHLFTLDQENDGEPIMFPCEIVENKDGEVKYVFEMKYTAEKVDDDNIMKVAWFNADGTPDHVDVLNLGPNVQATMVNLDRNHLRPDAYDTDDAMEYAVLVKRTTGPTTRNEFLIVDDSGEKYATFSADDGRGDPSMYTFLPGEPDRVMMVYVNNYAFNVDLYDLPFETIDAGVSDVITDAAVVIAYDGTTVTANGCYITVYAASGAKVATGREAVSLADLQPGVYVAAATDAAGKRHVAKLRKK